MLFSDKNIPGKTAETVNRLAGAGRLPQTVLLTGGSNSLREKCADELAGAVLCRNPKDGVPCKKCPECIRLKAGTHPDVIRLLPEKDKKTVSVQQLRRTVNDTLYMAPSEAQNKIYILPDADELSVVIQNTLLKNIEEPPAFVMFILEANQRESLLSTVISRCTELYLGRGSGGRVSAEDLNAKEIARNTAEALFRGSEYDILEALSKADKNRSLIKKTAAEIQTVIRDALIQKTGASVTTEDCRQAIGLAEKFSVSQLLKIKSVCDEMQEYAGNNANENLLLSLFSSALAQIQTEKETLAWQK